MRCSGAGFGAQQQIVELSTAFLPGTLLGPEATPVVVFSPLGLKCDVVAPSWWWGVVFDLWIVVASIFSKKLFCIVFCRKVFFVFVSV